MTDVATNAGIKIEESKGGIKFELLEEATGTPPPKKNSSPTRTISSENIDEKLKAAEERRLSLEAKKIGQLSAQLSKIEDAMKKKGEQHAEFITQTKKALEEKMEHYSEKKEAYITDIKSKLKEHFENVEKTRTNLEKQINEVNEHVNQKLKLAAENRDKHLNDLTRRLKEHDEHAKSIYNSMKEKQQKLEQFIVAKQEEAALRKEQNTKEILDKLKEVERRAEKVRQNRMSDSDIGKESELPSSG